MDYLKKIDEIIRILIINNKDDFAKKILDEKKNSFTSSALLLKIGYELNIAIENDREINSLIGRHARELIDFCRKIGLHIGR